MKGKLYRSRDNVIIGGVAAGLADYLDIDVSLVRLLWAFAAVMGPGLIAYVIAWLVIPQEPVVPDYLDTEEINGSYEAVDPVAEEGTNTQERQRTLGVILVIMGILFLLRQLIPGFVFSWTWPIVLIAFGLYLLVQDREKE